MAVLGVDYVDMLVPPMHSVRAVSDPSIPEEFEKAKKAGKVGFMGFACHKDMANVLNKARELGWFDVTLMGYGDAQNPKFLEAARKAREAGMGIMTMKGLAKRFSGGLNDEQIADTTSRCTAMVDRQHAHTVLASMGNFKAVDTYRDILETKLGYFDPERERRYWAQQQTNYCSQCGICTGICPSGEEISRAVRYRMYHNDYGMKDYAREQYAQLGITNKRLAELDFDTCERICPRSLPLRVMVEEAHSLLS
jgi:predicted aldo/keto reductase-like oxidoreductase